MLPFGGLLALSLLGAFLGSALGHDAMTFPKPRNSRTCCSD
jgi:hypothetical protein